MAMQSNENSRFTDLSDEPVDHLLSPIKGYEERPLVSLNETIKPISGLFNEIEDYVFVASHNCQNPLDDLTQEESAAIYLYTMQFHGGSSLYLLLNQALRAEDREELKPWFSFLKLFLTALHKLPSQSKIVWRGVKNINLSSKYKKGIKFAWWGISSCTTDIAVLESEQFLGKNGLRTLFSIECIHGKSVINHSYFKNTEKEIVLMPGSYFEVIGQLSPTSELHIIHLKEILPPITLVKSPFIKHSLPTPSIIIQNPTSNDSLEEITLNSNNSRWKQSGITVAGGNGRGKQLNQLSSPFSIFIDDDQTMFITDFDNHRIMEWRPNEKIGWIAAGINQCEEQGDQLNHPVDVIIDRETDCLIIADAGNRRIMRWSRQCNLYGQINFSNISCYSLKMDNEGSLHVSDSHKNEVRLFRIADDDGIVIAGGHNKGNHLNELNIPTFIFVDEEYSVYISDMNNHRVMKWQKNAKEGIIVAGGNGPGNNLSQLYYPHGIIVDQFGDIYVADSNNHRVMCWCQGAKEGMIVVGGNGEGEQLNQLRNPRGLSFDQEGNLYVVDCGNHRIQKFEIN